MTDPRRRAAASMLAVVVCTLVIGAAGPAHAQEDCPRAVIFTLPGVTWEQVQRFKPPELLAIAADGAVGSMSVRTNSSRTTYASGFVSLGAGARVDGGHSSGGPADEGSISDRGPFAPVRAAGLSEIRRLLDEAGYTTVDPGALAAAVEPNPVAVIGNSDAGMEPPVPEGRSRWGWLTAMDVRGNVDLAAADTLVEDPSAPFGVRSDPGRMVHAIDRVLEIPCVTLVIDPGDLTRADEAADLRHAYSAPEQAVALAAADELLGHVRSELEGDDLLLVVSPTSPAWDDDVHFGVAVAYGRGFPAGSALESPSTRRLGMVTLPDVAPTVLHHLGRTRPPSMLGRAMFARAASETDLISAAISLDEEAVFVDAMRTPLSSVFVIVQVVLYALVAVLLARRERNKSRTPNLALDRWLSLGALAVMAFPVCTYLVGFFNQRALGTLLFVALLLAIDALVVTIIAVALRNPFDRLLAVAAFTCGVLVVDLMTGANLQLNTVFSYSPLVAGRFSGIGNIAYSVLAAAAVIAGTLIVHRGGGSGRSLGVAGALFLLVIVVDGAPGFGADVGGILALVPGLGATWLLLGEKRPNIKTVALLVVALLVALAIFLAVDLAQPEASQTHLARLFEDARARGSDVFVDVVQRKIQTNLRVFRSTIWTYLVPPALALIALLLLRPRNRWERVAERYPRLRAGLIGGLILAVLGFAVNDSGIVVPAMMLALLVPLALFMHLSLEEDTS
ncbi:MAG: hypothetical protein QOK47_1682 [Actinomycetota bacterium]|nr:hypothetical protein [Actinomycetota bacterium]